ncbi:MAG: cisplatin damage response ATP-dependent DNA ligase [Pseudomonadota bacterium]
MKTYATLLERLVLSPQRTAKLRLIEDYLRAAPDPDRGWAVAALTGGVSFPAVKPAMLRALVAERVDEVLFALSYDYVGDLAETISLIWEGRGGNEVPSLSDVVATLSNASRSDAPARVAALLDAMGPSERYALLKLATGGMRVGVSARLAKQALAGFGSVDVTEIEELWHGLTPPFEDLFAWLEGRGDKPVHAQRSPFRPVMLATALEERDLEGLNPSDYLAEWKWDGIRVQATAEAGTRRLYSRTGDDIGQAFPDLLEAMTFEGSLDGELLVMRDGEIGTFGDLQQRLGRKTVSPKTRAAYPAYLRAYDLLQDGSTDLRRLPFEERRARLEIFAGDLDPARFDVSPTVPFDTWEEIATHRAAPPHPVIEGVMLKRRDSLYVPGRPKGPWFKWKRDPYLVDAVLMYAQRGHGKRSSYYSDYTFGVWTEEDELVPVGKAYFGFTDEELRHLDKFVRDHTVDRYGPVRAVRAGADFGLVLEIAFEGLNRSSRHKSGIAMRFPRISRLRWDKPAAEADRIETLEAMLPPR